MFLRTVLHIAVIRAAGGVHIGRALAQIFMAGGVLRCAGMARSFMLGAAVLLGCSLVTAFLMAHDTDEIDGCDEQADQDQHKPEGGAERGFGLGFSVMLPFVMMMCTVI